MRFITSAPPVAPQDRQKWPSDAGPSRTRDGCRRAGSIKLHIFPSRIHCSYPRSSWNAFLSVLSFSNTSWKGVCDNERLNHSSLGRRALIGHSEVAQTQVLFRIGMKSVIAKRATERDHPVLHPNVTIDVFPYDRPLADQASPVPVALLDNFNHKRVSCS